MELIDKLIFLRNSLKSSVYFWKLLQHPRFVNERYIGEIVRCTHSLEKGLSLEHVRSGFGYSKIKNACSIIKKYKNNNGDMQAEPLIMFIDALESYINYHHNIQYKNDTIEEIENLYVSLIKDIKTINHQYGGVKKIERKNYTREDQDLLARLFKNRHSMREFSKKPIDKEDLRKSIEMAMQCPSACNRQCYRLHIVDKKSFSLLNNGFEGVGGFADDLEKIMFITGKVSVYRPGEIHQWVVTSTVFASYLTLSLEAHNIGCCFIQRPVDYNKQWMDISKSIGAAEDEQLVCCLGIGKLKDSYTVPVSHRFDYDTIVSEI